MKNRFATVSVPVLSFALAAFAAACDQPSSSAPYASGSRGVSGAVPPPIHGAEAHQLVAAGAFLLDVRTPGEFQDGHAEGATNIPVSELESRLAEVPRHRVVITYCASDSRSRTAATILRAEHYDVRDLRTLSAWNE